LHFIAVYFEIAYLSENGIAIVEVGHRQAGVSRLLMQSQRWG
jgi:hypothetical protein